MLFRAFALAVFAIPTLACATLTVSKLRTEYLVDPLGIDERSPRFFWTLDSDERGQRQAAYRVLVATSPTRLVPGKADLWDSGRVHSGETIHVAYAGRPLRSRQRAFWTVIVWDRDGKKAQPVKNASFEMGLLNRGDWKAQWVGAPEAPGLPLDPKNAKWIWFPEGEPAKDAPTGDRWFKTTIAVGDLPVAQARLGIAVDDTFEAYIKGEKIAEGRGWTEFRTLDIGKHLRLPSNELMIKAHNDHSRAGLLVTGAVQTGTGARTNTVSIHSGADWMTSSDGKSWVAAKELAPFGGAPYGVTRSAQPAGPAPYLRRQFMTPKPVRRAVVYASARGLYELYLNGRKVGRDVFTPGWTDYHKRIQYQTYDVTSFLAQGAVTSLGDRSGPPVRSHVIGMIVGDGWYCGHVAWAGRQNYGPKPMGLAQLEIEYQDGTRETIATDATWSVASGPIRESDLLMGETYDARLELRGWNLPQPALQEPSPWQSPDVQPIGDVPLVAQRSQPVRHVQTLKARKLTEPKPNTFVFDLGQNMVGWARLKARGPAGTKVTLRHAEMLNPDGTIYTANLRAARATDTYILSGEGEEVYEPRFTFHGFRYVEVTGYPGTPGLDAIEGVVITSDTPVAGSFSTSNPLLNQLQSNIFWGQRGNYLEVPTDCPQRDERLGWMGDAQIFVWTASLNNDIAAFMTKWAQDVEDAQSAEGSFADVSPRIGIGPDGAPGWGDAGVIVPWAMYKTYGDRRLLSRRFDSMKRWVDFIHKHNPDLVWSKRGGNNYGDWLNVQDDTPRDLIGTAYFAHSTGIVAEAADVLGRTGDARRYEALRDAIVKVFNERYVKPDGSIAGDSQTAYVLALRFELLPEELRSLAAGHLRNLIANERKGHVSTGFLGCGHITHVLTATGSPELAHKLLLNETYPSWLYSVKNGATTIWERWDGWTEEKGFQDPGMNSFNHYAFGSVGEWMIGTLGGIARMSDSVAYTTIRMEPRPGPGVTSASAEHESIRGGIRCAWKLEGGEFRMSAKSPPGTRVALILPQSMAGTLRINGRPVRTAPFREPMREDRLIVWLASGPNEVRAKAPAEWLKP